MRCGKARKLIVRGAESAELADHLAQCVRCRAEAEALARVDDLLDTWQQANPKLGYDALLRMLVQRPAARRQTLLHPALPAWATAGLVAASIAVGIAAGVSTELPKPELVPSEQEVMAAMDLKTFGDIVEGSLTYGVDEDAKQGGVQ